uniref:hypothetical protein n=1 Tax=Niallia taxi TaxID=2499688 RepID=UPI003F4994B2
MDKKYHAKRQLLNFILLKEKDMDRYDYIESILLFLKGVTGINFQLQLREILRAYYKYKGLTYDMPDFYGGDQKNDGWVIEDAKFYQIFSPTRLKDSLKKEIEDKFKSDLEGLFKIVYVERKWKGNIQSFNFIVNTFDGNLPHDSQSYFSTLVEELNEKYKTNVQYLVSNCDHIRDLLEDVNDIEVLRKISASLRIRHLIDYNAISETIIISLIEEISGNISHQFLGSKQFGEYKRVSSLEKITINNLQGKKNEIDKIIGKLDVVEKAINVINQDILFENKFDRVKELIIEKYRELSLSYHGEELYDCLIKETLSYTNSETLSEVPMKFLIIYVFDKCDIFEKEEVISK